MLGFSGVPIVHEVVQRFGDMLGKARLDGQFGVFGSDEERE
jgi:hypothetical protein